MLTFLFAAFTLLGGALAGASVPIVSDQTPAGTELKYFGRVDEGVYKGSKPRSDADYRYLQSLHVKYIIDLHTLPWVDHWERRKARRYGIDLIPIEMNASPFSPSRRHVEHALALLHNERCLPIYFHCTLGRDRTALVAALYRMYFSGLTPEAGDQYLHDSGYKDGWVRSGLTRYLKNHPEPSAALSSAASTGSPCSAN